jgi:DNA-binding transcriptional LysR family regulator
MDKFQALRISSTVAESGGFSSAAKRLGISASAVTKAIARLESELDVQLFRRSTRHVALSGPGRLLLEHCSNVLEALSDAEAAVKKMRDSSGGNVRVVMPYSFGRVTFAPELPRFHARYPNITLDLYFNDDPTNLVAEGFDLAVLSRQLDDSPVIRRVLIRVPLVTAASPQYLAAHGTPKSLEDLAIHNCIIGKFGNEWQFRNDKGKPMSVAVNGSITIHSGDVLREAAAAGLGIAQSTWWLFRRDFADGTLVRLFEHNEVDGVPISVIYPNKKHLPREVKAVLDFLLEVTRFDDEHDRTREANPRSRRAAAE